MNSISFFSTFHKQDGVSREGEKLQDCITTCKTSCRSISLLVSHLHTEGSQKLNWTILTNSLRIGEPNSVAGFSPAVITNR